MWSTKPRLRPNFAYATNGILIYPQSGDYLGKLKPARTVLPWGRPQKQKQCRKNWGGAWQGTRPAHAFCGFIHRHVPVCTCPFKVLPSILSMAVFGRPRQGQLVRDWLQDGNPKKAVHQLNTDQPHNGRLPGQGWWYHRLPRVLNKVHSS